MIPIELGNGKTVMVKFEDWISMTDEQFQDLIAKNEGYEIDNPFDKVIDRIRNTEDWETKDIPEELAPKITEELTSEQIKKIEGDTN